MMLEPVTGESQTGAAAIEHKCADVESRQFDERHRLALRATNDVIWDWDLKTDTVWWNDAVSTLFGYASDQVELSSRWWRENIHPEDRGRVAQSIQTVLDGTGERCSGEYRFRRADGSWAEVLDRGYVTRDAMGVAVRMTGVMQDITERKRVHRFLELRAAECEHRAKNMLMLVQLILRRTQAESVSKYRTAAQERVAALARAHALVSESPREAADLRRLVEEILTPHRAGEPRRVRIEGDSFALSPRAAQAVAMSLHELATNAAKYGALSTPEGQVEIGWSSSPGGVFVLTWTETGAPPVAVPTRRGFGSAVIEATVQQLGGTATLLVWRPQGLRCVLRLPADAIKP